VSAFAPLQRWLTCCPRTYTCPSGYYRSGTYCYPNSAWYFWGRWVFAGVVIVVVIGILVLLGCINARRRRRRGVAPMYGTGWLGGKQNTGAPYAPQGGYQYGPPPPQYSQNAVPNQYTGNTYNSNDGYYGQQQQYSYGPQQNDGIQLQQPANTYSRGGDNGYEPPPGPPPNKIA